MSPWLMVVLAAAVVLAPFVLMLVFHGSNEADARGRRVSHRWHT